MHVYIASDHAGFEYKTVLSAFLQERGYTIHDMGPEAFAGDDDYPTYIAPCADQVVATAGSLGIIIGGSGQGEAIVANRVSGIRSIVYYGHNLDVVRIGRQHNDANMLSLGARCMDIAEAKNATLLFLTTDFSHEERHERRIKAIDA